MNASDVPIFNPADFPEGEFVVVLTEEPVEPTPTDEFVATAARGFARMMELLNTPKPSRHAKGRAPRAQVVAKRRAAAKIAKAYRKKNQAVRRAA
jgi:hypothetical protein